MNDDELVARVLQGHPDAFGSIVDRHYADCCRYAYRMLRNPEDAQDAVQESFLRAYRALGRYRARGRFRPWLFTILVNQCRTATNRRRKEWARFERDRETIRADHADGSAPARATEARDSLSHLLGKLDPNLREAFLLKHGEGLEYAEMAAVTGASVSALKMRVKRACDVMRPFLREDRT